MNRLITSDDIIDIFLKAKQRGLSFIFSKFTLSDNSRTSSAFNDSAEISSNWWDIPYIQKRWNRLISGHENQNYKQFLLETILKEKSNLRLLSLGSGSCGHEMELARAANFEKISCIDLSEYRISQARQQAKSEGLSNIEFFCTDISNFDFTENHFDIVLFNSSLHHFKSVDALLAQTIAPCLKTDGLLIINEYVGPTRLQFPKKQLEAVNNAIQLIPKKYRQRFKSSMHKNSFSGSGLLRVIVADPSECVDSASILPAIHRQFVPQIERPYGGNILMNALKDISHHFLTLDDEKQQILDDLFEFEDNYLKNNPSDFIFGVYKKA